MRVAIAWLLSAGTAWAGPPAHVQDARVDAAWEPAVWDDPFLSEGGTSVLVNAEGARMLAAVGVAPCAADAATSEHLAARRVAETLAKATIARFVGSTVETVATATTVRTGERTQDDAARVERIVAVHRTFHEMTTERSTQALLGARTLGTWSQDGAVAVLVGVPVP